MMNDFAPLELLVIGSVWPEPSSSAAGQRMMQLINCFQQANWQITFASAAEKGARAANLSSKGIKTQSIKMNDSSFDDFLISLQPDAVLFDRFITEEQFGWRVAEHSPEALRILDTEDLHSLRRTRKKVLDQGRELTLDDLISSEPAKREIASIYRCDLSLIISEYEYQLLREWFTVDDYLLHYLPFLYDKLGKSTTNSWPVFEDRQHFATIGNFRHNPNWDAVQHLNKTIWPHIRQQLPKAELHIYGAYPAKKATELHQPEIGFYIDGPVDEAQKVVRNARVLLAPLRFGAGLKGKLTEAMLCGTPSVTTPVGAEGLMGNMDWSGFVKKSPADFVESAVKLYSQKSLWKDSQQQGVNIINQRFQKSKFGQAFIDEVQKISSNLAKHRRQNFIGSMLMQQTAASTKYMSKWIEAKNTNGGRKT